MIKYIKHQDIDKDKWNECVWNSPNGLAYVFTWYLDIVAQEWDALVEDNYISVFPLPIKKKFGISYIYQPFWVQQLGLFSKTLITPEKSLQFLKHIPSHIRFIDYNLNNIQKLPENHSFRTISNNNYQLDLIYQYEHLYKNYSQNLKRNLKKTQKNLYIHEDVNPQNLIELFRKNRGENIKSLNENSYKQLLHLLYFTKSINLAKLWGMYDASNTLVAGVVFLVAKGRAILLFSATNDKGRELSAMHILIDAFINKYSEQNLILDFEGSNNDNLARFYKSFGASNTPYLRIQKSRLILPHNILVWFKNWIRK